MISQKLGELYIKFNKNIVLFLFILIVFLLSISIVSANDLNNTDVVKNTDDKTDLNSNQVLNKKISDNSNNSQIKKSDDEMNVTVVTDDIVKKSEYSDVSAFEFQSSSEGIENINAEQTDSSHQILTSDVPEDSFTALNNTISENYGKILNLTHDYQYYADYDSALASGIIINKNITILGNGYTLNGKNAARILYINGNNIAIHNLNLTNGYYSGDNAQGGAVRVVGNNITIGNSSFSQNYVSDFAGAAYISASNFVFEYCNFTSNTAQSHDGGAIYIANGGKNITIRSSNFISNFACNLGSAVCDVGNNVTVIDSYFYDNKNTQTDTEFGGSYVISTNSNHKLINCTFESNSNSIGGAIKTMTTTSNVEIINSTFKKNKASSTYGGALYIASSSTKVVGCTFSENSAVSYGIAIYWVGSNGNVTNSTFIGHSGETGTIFWLGSYAYLSKSNFYNNILTGSGGCVYFNCTGSSTNPNMVTECSFISNSAKWGAGISFSYPSSYLTVTKSYFENNTVNQGGCALNIDGSYVRVSDSTFINNTSLNAGNAASGIVRFVNETTYSDWSVKNCSFISNKGYVGAICINSRSGAHKITGCLFLNNYASYYGAVLYSLSSKTMTISDCIMLGNTNGQQNYDIATISSSSLVTANYNWWGNTVENKNTNIAKVYTSTVTVSNWYYLDISAVSTFLNISDNTTINFDLNKYATTTTTSTGTFAYTMPITLNLSATLGNISVNNVPLNSNNKASINYTAKQAGLAFITAKYENVTGNLKYLYNVPEDSFTALNILISENSGKVLNLTHDYQYYEELDFNLTSGIMIDNDMTINGNGFKVDAKNKTRIFNITGNNVVINNITLINGHASGNGGAIYWSGAKGILNNSNLNNNYASNAGGAVYWNGTNGVMDYTNITNNYAGGLGWTGGGVRWDGDYGIINHTIFDGNKAINYTSGDAGDAGALGIHGNYTSIDYCSFLNSASAQNGGAIGTSPYAYYLNITNTLFKNNSATKISSFNAVGGAIYFNKYVFANVYNCTFIANKASTNGGAISAGSKTIITSCLFVNNSCSAGQVMYASVNGCNISDSILLNNGDSNILSTSADDVKIVADNNWWGNTISTQKTKPGVNTARTTLTYWYFLNIQTNITYFLPNELCNVNYRLDQLTTSVGVVSERKLNYYLPDIFNYTATIGNLSFYSSILNETRNINNTFVSDTYGICTLTVTALGVTASTKIYCVPPDSFMALNMTIEKNYGADLNLTHGYQYYPDYDYLLVSTGVLINKPINITGNGYTLNAKQKTRVFRITASNVNLTNLKFTNGYAMGGAIYVTGNNLTVNNSYFTSNQATSNGGAMYIAGSYAKIIGCQFSTNKGTGSGSYGGAVFFHGNYGLIDKCTFTSNSAVYGGSIGLDKSDCIINNSVFNSNKGTWGGGINNHYDASNTKVLNSNFTSNVATYGGGGINANAKSLIDGCRFTSNKQTSYAKNAYCGGGGVRINAADSIVQNCVFTSNAAQTSKGDERVGGGAIQWIGTRGILNSSIFTSNSARFYGGALDWKGSNGNIDSCSFSKNSVRLNAKKGSGGVIKSYGSNLKIQRSNFTSNSAANYGGAIESNAYTIINQCIFTSNSASYYGGAIASWSKIEIYGTEFRSNSGGQYGGALLLKGSNSIVNNDTFYGNKAKWGAGINWDGSNGLINNSVFNNNVASVEGGALRTVPAIKIYDSNFTSNKATYGGVIECKGSKSIISGIIATSNSATWGGAFNIQATGVKILKSKFYYNVASNGGGAINSDFASDLVDGCYFKGNKANSASYGGAVIRTTKASWVVNNSVFEENTAAGFGGAISFQSDSSKVFNSNFTKNTAGKSYAGAVYISGKNGLVDNCNFNNNSAVIAGAVGFIGSSNVLNNSNFTNNKASNYGGAVYLVVSNTLDSSIFINNTASNYGGAVYVNGNSVVVSNSIFNQSYAVAGGAIYLASGNNVKVQKSEFNNNSAKLAGAVYMKSTNAVVDGSVFNYNVASDDAGAIYVAVVSSINNSNFTLNVAPSAGAIYIAADGSSINGSGFDNNSADVGAAVYIKAGSVLINESSFINHSGVNGSAVYWNGDSGVLSESVFISNIALLYGAAVYVAGNNLDLELSNFTDNNAKYGGAVYVVGEDAQLTSLNFNNNTAVMGGALYTKSQQSTINSTNFTNNTANYGAGMFILKNVILNPSVFTNNTAKYYGGAGYSYDFIAHEGTTLTYFNPEIHRDDFYSAFVKLVNDTIYVGDYAYLEVNSTHYRAVGIVYLEIDGVNYTGEWLNDTWIRINTTGLKKGVYEPCFGVFNSTDEFNGYYAVLSLTVKGWPVNLTLVNNETSISGNVSVRINETNASGNITIRFDNGFKYSGKIVDGVATIQLDEHVLGGLYNITLLYGGDDVYGDYENITSLKINKIVYVPSLKRNWTYVGDEVVIILPDDAYHYGGNVSFTINRYEYNALVVDNNMIFTLDSSIGAGVYDVRIWYEGNGKYNETVNLTTFEVVKYPTNITLDSDEIDYGGNITFRVESNYTGFGLITGTVSFVIDGVTYSGSLIHDEDDTDMYVIIDVSTLPAKLYENVTVTFTSTNGNYTGSIQNFTFTISKVASQIEIDSVINGTFNTTEVFVDFVVYNPTTLILVIYDSDGNVVYRNDTYEGWVFSAFNLTAGVYNLTLYNVEDENFTASFNSTLFEVYKISSALVINQVVNSTYNTTDALVNFTVTNRTSVNVTITDVNGTVVYTGIIDGVQFSINNLSAGIYNITVTNVGTESIYESSDSALFEVYKSGSFVNITSVVNGYYNTTNAEVNYTVVNLTNVKVIIKRNGTDIVVYEGDISGNFTMSSLGAGVYNITIINVESQNYTMSNASCIFEVYQMASFVNITKITNATYNTTSVVVNFDVTNRTNVSIIICKNGTSTEVIHINDFTGDEFTIGNLSAGIYNITIVNYDDGNYTMSNASAIFTINKSGSVLNITSVVNSTYNTTDVVVGFEVVNRTNISIVIRDADGNIVYEDDDFALDEFTIKSLDAGVYNITITNVENENYTSSNDTALFEVYKAYSSLEIINITGGVLNTSAAVVQFNITNKTVISIIIYDNATKEIVYENSSFEGSTFTIGTLSTGVYNITIINNDTVNYVGCNVSGVFKVVVPTSIIATDLNRGYNSPYDYVAVFTDEFGNVLNNTIVSMTVGGKEYNVTTNENGEAYLTQTTLSVGNHGISLYNPSTGEVSNYTVGIVERLQENKNIVMDFCDGTYYRVRAYGDDAKPVSGVIVKITINGVTYDVKTDKNGYASIKIRLNPNKFRITAEWKAYKINKIVVRQTLKAKSTTAKKSAKYFKYSATLKWSSGKAIAGKKITFKFRGKTYTAKTNKKGVATIKIKKSVLKKLRVGKKYKIGITYKNVDKGYISINNISKTIKIKK